MSAKNCPGSQRLVYAPTPTSSTASTAPTPAEVGSKKCYLRGRGKRIGGIRPDGRPSLGILIGARFR